MTTPAFDLLVVGGAGIDTIIRVPDLPMPYADSVQVEPVESYVAHTGTGVALGARTLGLTVKFVDFLGEDREGARIVGRFAGEGLDFSWLPTPHGTRRAVNLVSIADGRRMSFYDAREPAGQVMPASFYEPWLARSRHVHVSIMDYARHVLPVARRLGVPISTDLHSWDGIAEHQKDFAHTADIVFLSAAALGERRDTVIGEIFRHGRAEIVVATDGARGAYLGYLGRIKHFPAVTPPGPVVDSNGAGDAFVSGFLSGRLAGAGLETCMARGLRAGAFACTIRGTAEGFAAEEDLGLDKVTTWPTTISTDTATPSPGTSGTRSASTPG
jgi:sugar/nucleoside kinase (ribokinase family)